MNKLNFTAFPTLNTFKLNLRELTEKDSKEIFSLRSDDYVNQFNTREPQKTEEEALAFIERIRNGIQENKWLYWAISFIDDPKLIGTICLWNFSEDKQVAEIGYELIPKYEGKGIMNEALNKVIEFAFKTLQLKKIEAFTHKENETSIQLLKRNQFIISDKKPENEKDLIFEIFKYQNQSK